MTRSRKYMMGTALHIGMPSLENRSNHAGSTWPNHSRSDLIQTIIDFSLRSALEWRNQLLMTSDQTLTFLSVQDLKSNSRHGGRPSDHTFIWSQFSNLYDTTCDELNGQTANSKEPKKPTTRNGSGRIWVRVGNDSGYGRQNLQIFMLLMICNFFLCQQDFGAWCVVWWWESCPIMEGKYLGMAFIDNR